jgi:hypothetical protein
LCVKTPQPHGIRGRGYNYVAKSCPYLVAIGFMRRIGVRASHGISSGITKSARFWGDSRRAFPRTAICAGGFVTSVPDPPAASWV